MEKAHDISLDEPCVAHQAILFMLDVLMRSNKPSLTLEELYDSFGDKSFTPQMLRAVGGNEQGLKQFLLRYPSLFTLNGDLISANSGGNQLPRISTTPDRYLRKNKSIKSNTTNCVTGSTGGSASSTGSTDPNDSNTSTDLINSSLSSSSSSNGGGTGNGATNGEPYEMSKTMKEIEQEAIAFFRKQMTKREEDWLPIVSVAGHASQSSADIRKFVGPQNEFKSFLVKYPHIFIVRDEYCGLKGRADVSSQPFPPPSPPPKRRLPPSLINTAGLMGPGGVSGGGSPAILTRTHSFKNANRYSACVLPTTPNGLTTSLISTHQSILSPNTSAAAALMNPVVANNASSSNLGGLINNSGVNLNKPRLTPTEVRAVHYVMRILHKNGRMLLQTIPGLISRAPDQVSNVVGFTREDLIQFFKRHSAIFQLHPDGCVSVKQDAVKALILKDLSNVNSSSGVISPSSTVGGLASLPSSSTLANGGQGVDGNPSITSNGVVLRIFPKYGILNMENNEQVFFDIQSCQFETFNDLTTILHMGDRLYFNAVIGPRDGSTKWRSIKTWIKMKSQQQPTVSAGVGGLFDNMSSHSDADKSDDSSTSSSNNNNINNNQSFNLMSNNPYSNSSSHRNLFYHPANQQFVNQHQFGQQVGAFNANNVGNGQFYLLNGSNTAVPTPASLQTPTSPTSISSTSSSISSTSSSASNSHQVTPGGTGMGSGANTHVTTSTPNGTAGLDDNNNHTNTSNSNLQSASHQSSSHAISHVSSSGEFNQYQLDNGDYLPQTATNKIGDEVEHSSTDSSHTLIHSSSANNLTHSNASGPSSSSASASAAIPNSKSIHSLNDSSNSSKNDNQPPHPTNAAPTPATATTRFMKQSPDNISQRVEVVEAKTEKILVSIGCQTISTGDVTVTDVYIE